jgi:hypothetical protein
VAGVGCYDTRNYLSLDRISEIVMFGDFGLERLILLLHTLALMGNSD